MTDLDTPPDHPVWWAVTQEGAMPEDMRLYVKAQSWFEARSKLECFSALGGKEIVRVTDNKQLEELDRHEQAEAHRNPDNSKANGHRPRRT